MTQEIKCECPEKSIVPFEMQPLYSQEEKSGMNHEPNKCKGTNEIKLWKRGKLKLNLCSCCSISSDEEIRK